MVVLKKLCFLKMFIKKLWKSSCIPVKLIRCLLWVDDVEPHRTFVAGCLMSRLALLSAVWSSYAMDSPAPVMSQSSVSVPSPWNERKCPHAFARYCAFVIMGSHQKESRDVEFDSRQADGSGAAPLTAQRRWEGGTRQDCCYTVWPRRKKSERHQVQSETRCHKGQEERGARTLFYSPISCHLWSSSCVPH